MDRNANETAMARCRVWGAKVIFTALLLPIGATAWSADSFITKTPDSTGKFCHLRFPAIREDTLYTDHPALKDPASGDIVDLYAPCSYDPLGKEEVERQRAYQRHIRDQQMYSD
jgi:hypothetical protein